MSQITREQDDAINADRYMRYILLYYAAYIRMPDAYCQTNDKNKHIKPSFGQMVGWQQTLQGPQLAKGDECLP